MLQSILEEIVSTLAGNAVQTGFQKGQGKHPRLFGWLALGILFALILGVTVLGIYLLRQNAVAVAILMFLIAALLLWITIRAIRMGRRAG